MPNIRSVTRKNAKREKIQSLLIYWVIIVVSVLRKQKSPILDLWMKAVCRSEKKTIEQRKKIMEKPARSTGANREWLKEGQRKKESLEIMQYTRFHHRPSALYSPSPWGLRYSSWYRVPWVGNGIWLVGSLPGQVGRASSSCAISWFGRWQTMDMLESDLTNWVVLPHTWSSSLRSSSIVLCVSSDSTFCSDLIWMLRLTLTFLCLKL